MNNLDIPNPDRQSWRPGTMLYPLPAVLVTCGTSVENSNMTTVAWTGTICSDPAMLYISVRPSRHSYPIIKETMEFTVNLTTAAMARATDWAGVRSGSQYNKWAETGLTPMPGQLNACPYIKESPLSIECKVKQIISLGTHDMFIAEVVNVLADSQYINPETGAFDMARPGMLVYCHGGYYEMGDFIGRFGFSVKKTR